MVDPNPGRGMPPQLQRYWLAGKGAAKIRWNVPGDFKRCVRALRSKFPKNPEGLCNILHTKATGGPPGHGSREMAITASAKALLAEQPKMGKLWMGPLAPINRPTGEPSRMRVFEPGALRHRELPLPLRWQKVSSQGHEGAVTVGRILGITYGPDDKGADHAWAFGDWLDPDVVPEVKEAMYLNTNGVLAPSVDPGGRVAAQLNPETGAEHMMEYTIGGATLVGIAAFDFAPGLRLQTFDDSDDHEWSDDDMTMDLDEDDCGCGEYSTTAPGHTFSINPNGWKGLPLAARNAVFDNDDAVLRIAAWAGVNANGADQEKLRRAFLWQDPRMPGTNTQSYRLPVGDIINGELTLVYHAIYAAAALISGAHGGLPNVPEEDRNKLRDVITGIYNVMAKEFNDASIRAPWDRPETREQAAMGTDTAVEFAVNEQGFPVAPPKQWFNNPGLKGKTPLTVDPQGRVFGHLAAWNECHRDVGARECILAPRSRKEYAPFHLGQVMTAEGDQVKVGKIVMDTRHAGIHMNYAAAAIHYDHTGDEVAVVRAGEDDYGIWVAGAVVPEATRAKVAKLRRSPLSGDWRAVDGNLELTAALAVNVPAFPVYAMDNDERLALVAAGTVYSGPESVEEFTPPPFGITQGGDDELTPEQDNRRWELLEILDAEEEVNRQERAKELAKIFAADPTQGAPVAPGPDVAMAARQRDAQFVVLEDATGASETDTPDEGSEEKVTDAESGATASGVSVEK